MLRFRHSTYCAATQRCSLRLLVHPSKLVCSRSLTERRGIRSPLLVRSWPSRRCAPFGSPVRQHVSELTASVRSPRAPSARRPLLSLRSLVESLRVVEMSLQCCHEVVTPECCFVTRVSKSFVSVGGGSPARSDVGLWCSGSTVRFAILRARVRFLPGPPLRYSLQ